MTGREGATPQVLEEAEEEEEDKEKEQEKEKDKELEGAANRMRN